ncbi:MAG TPA: hypothetical protein VLZ83_03175 [Edaphocola sp.]|nr:hypothetical protein [Edaphocola sp.]
MKNIIIRIAVLCLSLLSCNKYRNNQYSTWYVNGEEFKTNKVDISKGEDAYGISSIPQNSPNSFDIGFHSIPFGGKYIGRPFNFSDPNLASMKINYQNKKYKAIDSNDVVICKRVNEKLQITLNDTWFYNYDYGSNNSIIIHYDDSVLIKGVFNEP